MLSQFFYFVKRNTKKLSTILSSNVDNLCITFNMKKFLLLLAHRANILRHTGKACVAIFSCFLIIFSCTGCKKKENLADIGKNLTTYEININLDAETKTATATQNVCYVNNTNTILKVIKFHLYPQFFEQGGTNYILPSTKLNNAYPNGISYGEFNIDRVIANGEEKSVVYSGEMDGILDVELTNSLMPEDVVEINLEYSFTLPNCHHRFGYGNNTINLGNFYPIVCSFDNGEFNTSPYHQNGDPFYSDVANYSVSIVADYQYVVASTGEKVFEETNGNNKKTEFHASVVRDFAIVLSKNFQIASEQTKTATIEYYYFNDTNYASSLKAGADAISTFSKLFGEYPYKTFSIIQADFIHGGMEYPNLILVSADILDADDYKNVIVHETAHQWWYGMVGNDQFKHPWLDEALTEYSTLLFYDHNEGYNLTHTNMVKISRENYSLFISVYEDVLGTINTSMRSVNEYETEPEYTYCTYVKGVLMWDSLQSLIGEKKMLQALQHYFSSNKFKVATPDDLIASFNEASKQNLEPFFSSWLNGHVVIR